MKHIYAALFVFVLFFSIQNLQSQTMPMKNSFYIGYHGGFYNNWNWNVVFPRFNELNINFMQNYGNHAEYGDSLDGGFRDDISLYSTNVGNLFANWQSTFPGNNALFMEREKVLRGGYGQISSYQSEFVSGSTHPRYGYEFRNGTPYEEWVNGEHIYGIHTGMPDNNGYWMLNGLYENEEQVNFPKVFPFQQYWDISYYYSDIKTPGYKWFVMPRMRISTTDAFGTSKPVCRIVVIPYDGDTTDGNTRKVDLFTTNFRSINGQYSGEYLEAYLNIDLSIVGSQLNRGNPNITYGDVPKTPLTGNNVDYRIYWYGQVDVWLDRVRVADEWAYYLFHPEIDALQQTPYFFREKIQEECEHSSIGANPNFGYFYLDEYMYNSLPCIAEVNRLIKTYKPNSGLVTELNTTLVAYFGNKWPYYPTFDEIFERVVSTQAVTDVLFMYVYPFTYKSVNIELDNVSLMPLPPNLLYLPDTTSNPGTVDYYQSASKENYNDTINHWLQNGFYSGFGYNICLVDQFRRAASLQKNHPDIIFCAGTQSHSYEDPILFQIANPYGILREPTNEEISLQDYMALAYGARTILQYAYYSYHPNNNSSYNSWGVEDIGGINKREINYYGQQKFNYVSALNLKLKNLGSYLFNYNWQTGYSVHVDGADHQYIQSILSVDPRVQGSNGCVEDSPAGIWADCPDKRYWEMTFFEPKIPSANGTKYFMMVNRRCTPDINNNGDVRALRIHFKPELLLNYDTWKISDVMNRSISYSFLKSYQGVGGYVAMGTQPGDPGYFKPGEGKLYKLEPVATTGGTLQGDETIPSGNYTILDTIFTNGYDLTIEAGATLHFTDSSTIVVNGGKFTAGSTGATVNQITFGAVSENTFHGLYFTDGAEAKIYNSTFSGLANDTSYAVNIVNCPIADIRTSTFNAGSNSLVGGINMTYYSEPEGGNNIYLGYNTFEAGSSSIPFVNIIAYSGTMVPAIVEHNTFNSTAGACGLMLSGVTGGAVKSNTFTNFGRSVSALSSSIDVYGNTFTNESATSTGLEGLSGTELRLNKVGSSFIGGLNIFSNNQSSSSIHTATPKESPQVRRTPTESSTNLRPSL